MNDWYQLELFAFDGNTSNHLTVCYYNFLCKIAILETMELCAKKKALVQLKNVTYQQFT